MDEKELSLQPISDSEETMNAVTLKSVKFDEFSIMDEYLSEPEETLEVSSYESDITFAQNKNDEVEKEIGVIFEKLEEPQKESKEDQPLVLVKPSTILQAPNELPNQKEGMHVSLPKVVDALFVVDILKGEGIT
ncbi:hypothetical protein Scep_009706 [Stephania cephalantha]|uniref:Uncharacterized protein n=1 Tax=Stephania cephalantha TaxID=152367 RepID=A0AAP0JVZ1_9MAGN